MIQANLFSIVIPLYNEKGNIPPLLEQFLEFVGRYHFELILVNDGSKDGTKEELDKLEKQKYPFLKVVSYDKNKGYGGAILTGLSEATGDILGWMHSDLQTDVTYVFEAYKLFLESKNEEVLVKGFRKGRNVGQVLFSFCMGVICSIVFLSGLSEINAQPKVFSRKLYCLFSDAPTDFSLDLYLLVLGKRNKFAVKSIDVNFIDRKFGESKWAYSFSSKVRTIRRTLKYIMLLRNKKS